MPYRLVRRRLLYSMCRCRQFSQLQEALLAGQFTLTTPLHAVCRAAISHYHCDILLVGDRPVYPAYRRSSGAAGLVVMYWMDKYRVHEW